MPPPGKLASEPPEHGAAADRPRESRSSVLSSAPSYGTMPSTICRNPRQDPLSLTAGGSLTTGHPRSGSNSQRRAGRTRPSFPRSWLTDTLLAGLMACMSETTFPFWVVFQRLDSGLVLAEALGFPEVSRLGADRRRLGDQLRRNLLRLLEDAPLSALYRRQVGGQPAGDAVAVPLDPVERGAGGRGSLPRGAVLRLAHSNSLLATFLWLSARVHKNAGVAENVANCPRHRLTGPGSALTVGGSAPNGRRWRKYIKEGHLQRRHRGRPNGHPRTVPRAESRETMPCPRC
jgi:hypothetical protein